jgi:hypothetical protein
MLFSFKKLLSTFWKSHFKQNIDSWEKCFTKKCGWSSRRTMFVCLFVCLFVYVIEREPIQPFCFKWVTFL